MAGRKRVQKSPPTVLVLESHPLAARYLAQLLDGRCACRLVATRKGFPPLPTAPRLPAVLVVSKRILSDEGSLTLQSIRAAFPSSKILLIGDSVQDEELLRFVLQGVNGFVRYGNAAKELVRAVHGVAQGHVWLQRQVLDKLPGFDEALSPASSDDTSRLTSRECAITYLLEQRLSNKEIASRLAISERTVKFHMKNLFRKLGVHDRHSATDLIRSGRIFRSA